MILTRDELAAYLGIDCRDEMVIKNLDRVILTADSYLRGAVGDDYPEDDPKAKEIALIVSEDLYDTRGLSGGVSGNARRLVHSLEEQLRSERRRRAEVDAVEGI